MVQPPFPKGDEDDDKDDGEDGMMMEKEDSDDDGDEAEDGMAGPDLQMLNLSLHHSQSFLLPLLTTKIRLPGKYQRNTTSNIFWIFNDISKKYYLWKFSKVSKFLYWPFQTPNSIYRFYAGQANDRLAPPILHHFDN